MRRLFGLFMALLLVTSAIPAVAAQDTLDCGDIAPTRYSYKVVDDEGLAGGGPSSDTATFKFRLTRNEIAALRCGGSSAVIDFRFTNYEYRPGETEVTFGGDELGAYHVLAEDPNGNPVMRAIIDPYDLVPNRTYTIAVTFRMFYATNLNTGEPHLLSLEWASGEWFTEDYAGECDDYLLDEVDVNGSTYCHARYDDGAVELGVHDFGY